MGNSEMAYSPVTKRVEEWVLSAYKKAIAKHVRIVLLDKVMMAADARRFDMAALSSQTMHACFSVAFLTEVPTRFVNGEYKT